jgi:hypothetical protein
MKCLETKDLENLHTTVLCSYMCVLTIRMRAPSPLPQNSVELQKNIYLTQARAFIKDSENLHTVLVRVHANGTHESSFSHVHGTVSSNKRTFDAKRELLLDIWKNLQ